MEFSFKSSKHEFFWCLSVHDEGLHSEFFSLNHADPTQSSFPSFLPSIKSLFFSLLCLCSPLLLSFPPFFFSFPSVPALFNSFFPHSKFYLSPHMSIHPFLLLCPCQTLSNPFLLLYGSTPPSMPSGYLPLGQHPPAAIPKAPVPTYPAGWWCTAGWQSEPPYWGPQRRGMPRLGISGSCRGAGMGTPAALRCWCRSVMAPHCPKRRWAARIVPGSGGWNAAALQWCWLCCLQRGGGGEGLKKRSLGTLDLTD